MTWAILFTTTPDPESGLAFPAVRCPPYTFLPDSVPQGVRHAFKPLLLEFKTFLKKMGRSAPSALLSPHVASAADAPKSLP